MMRFLIANLFIIFMLGLTGCKTFSPTGSSTDYTPPPERHLQTLNNTASAPHSSELDGQAMNIIWNIDTDVRDKLDLTEDLKEQMTHYLKAEGIQINDPKNKKTRHLIEEIERARRNSSALTSILTQGGEQKVQYYIKGSLTKSSLSAGYSSPLWCPFCEDKRPGTCSYSLDAGLQIEVLSLPSLKRVKHFSLDIDESYSVDVFDRCARYNSNSESINEYQDSRDDIIEDLVDCSGKVLETFLSPSAYIEKYFSDGEQHIYQISSGSAAGFKEGDDLMVLRGNSVGFVQIGAASVIAVQPYKAYVAVSDKKLLQSIRLYDQVKVETTDYTLGVGCIGVLKEH